MPRLAAAAPRVPAKSSRADVVTLRTSSDARAFADRVARAIVGVSSRDAFAKLDRGEFKGTLAGSELRMLRGLVGK